jgi:NAD(P)H-hydrate epimerase
VSLPDWLSALPDAQQMRETDRWAIEEQGIPSLELMERAGAGLAQVVQDAAGGEPVSIVCGKGNNGGDGYVAARVLREHGCDVRVLHVGSLDDVAGDAKVNLERLPGAPPEPLADLGGRGVAVDALLGTGSAGAPHGDVAKAIEALNGFSGTVVACDVPSGVDASTGEVPGVAVRASVTATFAAAKPGLWIHPGKAHAGQVTVIDIGIPPGAPVEPEIGLIEPSALEAYPRRRADSTKFVSGHVLVAGGSRGMTGAPCLASLAAMRAGAGYVTACVPASLEPIFEAKLTEVMTAGLPDRDGGLLADGAAEVLERARERGGALVVGPGIGRSSAARAFARGVAADAPVAIVLDADGLNAHEGAVQDLRGRSAPTVLTPHAGELARLLGTESREVAASRLAHARRAASESGAIVVLKGDDTLVAAPGGPVGVSRGGSPALATAGTGDVLGGVVGAFLARGMEPFAAACAAVYVHAVAGQRAAHAVGGADGVVASDVVDQLPRALAPSP